MTAAHAELSGPPLTRSEARELTDSIKRGVERTWGQLSEAFTRRAWVALEFPSWESYVRAEFGIGRSRSYQLLDQAKVIAEIRAAAGVHTVDITEATARDLKPRLAEVTEQVAAAVADVPETERPAVVADVVRDAREQFIADRDTGEVLSPEQWAAQPWQPEVEQPRPADSPPAPEQPPQDWSPSDALDRRRPRSPGPSRPASTPARPATIEQEFTEAAQELRKAVDRVERLSADGRFAGYAHKLNDKHSEGINYAIEGLGLVRIRLRSSNNGGRP